MLPVLLIGDFALDLIYSDTIFQPLAGGSVFNVASLLRKHNIDVCFISRVGTDLPGKILLKQVIKLGIPENTVLQDDNFQTSAAFCEYDSEGKAHYSFYKDKKDFILPDEKLWNRKFSLFHMGSSFAFSQTSFAAVMKVCDAMIKHKVPITYDINLRKIPTDAEKERIFKLMDKAQIIKGSDEDFNFLYGTSEKKIIMNEIVSGNNKIGIITFGKSGAFLFSKSDSYFAEPNKIIKNAKSIGAGDSFMAGIIIFYQKNFSFDNLEKLGQFANNIAVDFLLANGCVQ